MHLQRVRRLFLLGCSPGCGSTRPALPVRLLPRLSPRAITWCRNQPASTTPPSIFQLPAHRSAFRYRYRWWSISSAPSDYHSNKLTILFTRLHISNTPFHASHLSSTNLQTSRNKSLSFFSVSTHQRSFSNHIVFPLIRGFFKSEKKNTTMIADLVSYSFSCFRRLQNSFCYARQTSSNNSTLPCLTRSIALTPLPHELFLFLPVLDKRHSF